MEFPILTSERLALRELTLADAETIFPHFADEEVARFIDFAPARTTEDIAEITRWGRGHFEAGTGILWGIYRKADDSFLGQVNYVIRKDNNFTGNAHRAEIGFELSPAYWRNGYASEVIRISIAFVFGTMRVNRVEAIVHPENVRSQKVLNRLGFHREGTLREYVMWDGQFWDMVSFSLLKREWTRLSNAGNAQRDGRTEQLHRPDL